ncbi:hypothetical protein N7365_10710 [Pseudomonas sediminis]|uniref:hypothetical protein n=1 Tax=Pseudomonas sediminis TaxID=1691904 RepID=UPI00244CB81A|nr:hypothetical protein [Pseudomonas sediminis]MDG9758567.1 hypothetical protein [Pseudomonas sediminis]
MNNFFVKDSYFYPAILVAFFFISYSFLLKKNSVRYSEVFFGFAAFIVLILYYPFVKDEFQKHFFLSVMAFVFFYFYAIYFNCCYGGLLNVNIKNVSSVFYILIFLCFVGAAIDLPGKNTIVYSEPSHLALALSPLYIYIMLKAKGFLSRLFNSFLLLALSLFVQNLVMFYLFVFGWILCLYFSRFFYIKVVFLLPIVFFIVISSDYFLDRINLNPIDEVNNLSLLVFLSGWERAYLNFIETNGFGLGFNMLGYYGEQGVAMDKVFDSSGSYLNLYDGGSLAPKMISELGLIGIFLLVLYLFFFFKLLGKAKAGAISNNEFSFSFSLYAAFSIELFVRGMGYFSILSVVFFISVLSLFRLKE